MAKIAHPLDSASRHFDATIYAPREEKDAGILVAASSHAVSVLNTAARLLITSDEELSGKTTFMDGMEVISHNPWWTDPTPYALRSAYKRPEPITPFYDEISKAFGESGNLGKTRPEYRILVEGYRRKAKLSFSVQGTEHEVSCFGVAVMAGLKTAAPKDLRTRSIIIKMRRKPEWVQLEDSLDPGVEARGKLVGEALHTWVMQHIDEIKEGLKDLRGIHPKLDSRLAQIWGPSFVIARIAGPEWFERCMRAFVKLGLDSASKPKLITEQQILMDAASYLRSLPEMPYYLLSRELLTHLWTLDNKTYKAQTKRQMGMLMSREEALGQARTVTLPDRKTAKGWNTKAVMAAAGELETELMEHEALPEPDEFDKFFDTEDEATETTETTVLPAA